MTSYKAPEVEKKWQKKWDDSKLYNTDLQDTSKEKYYNLVMFPYPSGDKLHVGHWYNYAPADSWGRYMRMKGFNVFQPMGFDAFGLPAENYAIKTGIAPQESTDGNVGRMIEQLKRIGCMYDWDKMVNTSTPEYYKWTQWLFVQMFNNDLAYKKKSTVNYCPSCKTVLANEQVWNGKCERCKSEVTQKDLEQWFWKTTNYSQRLLDGLEDLDWPEKTKLMQKNWIGRSEGCDVMWKVKDSDLELGTFTTTVDTIYGVTFVVISPEHPDLKTLIKDEHKDEVSKYIKAAKKKTEINRMAEGKEKTGVNTGSVLIHPLTGEEVPLWVADYVLMNYGTGVVMGVPAHDQRDMDFAKKYDFKIIESVKLQSGESFVYDDVDKYNVKGEIIDSGDFSGLGILDGRKKITAFLEDGGRGKKKIQYKLRDWLLSRQRYWGAPIPIIYCDKCGPVTVPEDQLPVKLPEDVEYKPTGGESSPLATSDDFVNTKCPKCDGPGKREVDTMDTFVCSSWYYLRYLDAHNDEAAWEKKVVNKGMPVDMYIGGPEHACMHLIYARFVMMALNDFGFTDHSEPFKKLVHQGLVTKDGSKMSKSKGNVVSPDEFVEKYGSDTFRMYLMFMGPFRDGGDWSDQGITGIARFVDRFWNCVVKKSEVKDKELMEKSLHKLIKKCTEDIEKFTFNTAIAAMMEFVNLVYKNGIDEKSKKILARLISPIAPHLAEECWEFLGEAYSVVDSPWPEYDSKLVVDSEVVIGVQVNGKVRGEIKMAKDAKEDEAVSVAREIENVEKYLKEGEIKKIIYVPGRILGFVVK
jgi:leucyl-tRNA synthetase